MEFVDRIEEQRRLHQALHGENPSGLVVVRWSTMENPLSSCREWQLDRWHSLECSQPMVGKRLT